jgi:hypothetical protein
VPSETEFLGTVCIEREHERVRVAKCHMHTHVSIQKEWHALVPMNTVTRNSDAHTVGLGLIPLEYSPESLFILQDYFYVFVLDDESTRDEICYSPFCICCFLPRVRQHVTFVMVPFTHDESHTSSREQANLVI